MSMALLRDTVAKRRDKTCFAMRCRCRVCRLHQKAAEAMVNDKLQRFCQLCSFFHPTPEFDGTKRSCRSGYAPNLLLRCTPTKQASKAAQGLATC